jgi:hypothetical protein
LTRGFRAHPPGGDFSSSSLRHATRRLPPLRSCGGRGSSWGNGKHQFTSAYMLFLAHWARRLSWKETAEAFCTSWENVFNAVEQVVTFGLG